MLWLTVGEYGVPKRWYFLFTKSYWCSKYSTGDDCGPAEQSIELDFNSEGHFFIEHFLTLLPSVVFVVVAHIVVRSSCSTVQ